MQTEERTASVIVDVSVDRAFDYLIPADLQERVQMGSRVSVPFGPRTTQGYVVAIGQSGSVRSGVVLKALKGVVGPAPYMNAEILQLIRWMATYYGARMEQCIRTVLPGAVRKKGAGFRKQRMASLVPRDRSGSKITPAQEKILAALEAAGGDMAVAELVRAAGTSASPLQTLSRIGHVAISETNCARDPFAQASILPTDPLPLMPQQQTALQAILEMMASPTPRPILLYGVTGSGKTEVYLQAIAAALTKGKQAIVLVPEIALTPQTVSRFRARFGDRIAVLHSHLSEGERHDQWHRIRAGGADVVIGARSAVFAPVPDPGVIIVDEEHESSYKQSEAPRYNARDVAVMRAHLCGCSVVLGSATPSLESWTNARKGKYQLCSLPDRADYRQMPVVRVVDMRIEAERNGKPLVFAKALLDAIHARLAAGEQTMLFLNRRGYSSSLMCPQCGYVSECPHCSVAHTYHRTNQQLRCHICGGKAAVPPRCPACGDPAIRYAGFGTQRVEAIMQTCFPSARIARMDADTTRRKHAYETILGAFHDREIDILIGTQMIAKGLHFPNVTLVGIVFADMSLHLPDFRAGERTFQLITQVAGRAGRGDVCGEVFIQTYTPHHTAVQTARDLDYEGFAADELAFRQELHYPPAAHLTCLHFRGVNEAEVRVAAERFAAELMEAVGTSMLVSDATPAPLAKAKNIYRYQIMVRARSVQRMHGILQKIGRTVAIPKTVTFAVDVDAIDLM